MVVKYIVLSAKQIRESTNVDSLDESMLLGLDKPTANALTSISQHIYILQSDPNYTVNQSSRVSSLLDIMDSFLETQKSSSVASTQPHVKSMFVAMKIFLKFQLTKFTPVDEDLNICATELSSVIQVPHIRLCSSMDLLFWKLMMGRIAASDLQLQDLFTSMIQKTAWALQLCSWTQALTVLRTFFWEDSLLEPCHSVWLDVESQLTHLTYCKD